jgi:hypothetical protein
MIEHAVRVGATTARERVPERIAEALLEDARKVAVAVEPPDLEASRAPDAPAEGAGAPVEAAT